MLQKKVQKNLGSTAGVEDKMHFIRSDGKKNFSKIPPYRPCFLLSRGYDPNFATVDNRKHSATKIIRQILRGVVGFFIFKNFLRLRSSYLVGATTNFSGVDVGGSGVRIFFFE